jgi:hypothetical protein
MMRQLGRVRDGRMRLSIGCGRADSVAGRHEPRANHVARNLGREAHRKVDPVGNEIQIGVGKGEVELDSRISSWRRKRRGASSFRPSIKAFTARCAAMRFHSLAWD